MKCLQPQGAGLVGDIHLLFQLTQNHLIIYFFGPILLTDIADSVFYILSAPPHVQVNKKCKFIQDKFLLTKCSHFAGSRHFNAANRAAILNAYLLVA